MYVLDLAQADFLSILTFKMQLDENKKKHLSFFYYPVQLVYIFHLLKKNILSHAVLE